MAHEERAEDDTVAASAGVIFLAISNPFEVEGITRWTSGLSNADKARALGASISYKSEFVRAGQKRLILSWMMLELVM